MDVSIKPNINKTIKQIEIAYTTNRIDQI